MASTPNSINLPQNTTSVSANDAAASETKSACESVIAPEDTQKTFWNALINKDLKNVRALLTQYPSLINMKGTNPLLILEKTKMGLTIVDFAHSLVKFEAAALLENLLNEAKARMNQVFPIAESSNSTFINIPSATSDTALELKASTELDTKSANETVMAPQDMQTTFWNALINGNLDIVRELLTQYPSLISMQGSLTYKTQDNKTHTWINCTIMMAAAFGGHIPAMAFLLSKKQDLINIRRNDGVTILMFSALGGYIPAIDYLLKKKWDLINMRTNLGVTVLMFSAFGEHVQTIQYLHRANPFLILAMSKSGLTTIEYAKKSKKQGAETLLQKLFDEVKSCTPQSSSFVQQWKEVAEGDKKSNDDSILPSRPIQKKFWYGLLSADLKGSQELLTKYPSLINLRRSLGNMYGATIHDATVLMAAALSGDIYVINFLLSINPNLLNITTKDGYHVLMYAARSGKPPMLEFILEKKPDLMNAIAYNGSTILMEVAYEGNIPVIQYLHKANPFLILATNKSGQTAIDLAKIARKRGATALLQSFWNLMCPENISKISKDASDKIVLASEDIQKIFLQKNFNEAKACTNQAVPVAAPSSTTFINIPSAASNTTQDDTSLFKRLLAIKDELLKIKDEEIQKLQQEIILLKQTHQLFSENAINSSRAITSNKRPSIENLLMNNKKQRISPNSTETDKSSSSSSKPN